MRFSSVIVAVGLFFAINSVVEAQFLTIVSNKPGVFEDISVTGTELDLGDDQEAVIPPGPWIGNGVFPAGSVVVANNGGLGFPSVGGLNDLAPVNSPIPSLQAFNGRQSALGYWDNLAGNNSLGKPGNVYWRVSGADLVVQWQDRSVPGGAETGLNTVTFQIRLYGNVVSGPGAIYAQYFYQDVQQPGPNGGASATIGYQDGPAPFNDVQWSFNTPGSVSNGTILSLIDRSSVPAVSEVGQVVMVLLLLTGGALVFRRGRRTVAAG